MSTEVATSESHKRSKFVDSKQASGPGNYEGTLQVKRHYLTRSRANQRMFVPVCINRDHPRFLYIAILTT
ncbi:hypothetical protein NC652_035159 [Populus alba x Populus x berolinensis]|nr:hypothetical protein NC652_035155 [Populus alba x Populus x berolinensis]KAJ6875699.1 hypothetical protein NC652_035159 [Populus alba x Populus x berolinensis]